MFEFLAMELEASSRKAKIGIFLKKCVLFLFCRPPAKLSCWAASQLQTQIGSSLKSVRLHLHFPHLFLSPAFPLTYSSSFIVAFFFLQREVRKYVRGQSIQGRRKWAAIKKSPKERGQLKIDDFFRLSTNIHNTNFCWPCCFFH